MRRTGAAVCGGPREQEMASRLAASGCASQRLSRGPASVMELAQPLDMALPSVMKHLRVLEEGRWVRSKKTGRARIYSLEPRAFSVIDKWVAQRRRASPPSCGRNQGGPVSLPTNRPEGVRNHGRYRAGSLSRPARMRFHASPSKRQRSHVGLVRS